MAKKHEDLEVAILEVLAERGRISITELSKDLDSTSEAVQIPLGHLKESDKVTIAGDDVILKMSAKDRKDFERLDQKFQKGQRESIAALREIRDRKLFREEFNSFTAYVAARGKTVPWATQQINWLRRIELLEENGKDPYQSQLTVNDVQVLGPLENEPEAFVRAVVEGVEEAERLGKKQKKPFLKDAVARQVQYLDQRQKLPDLTYEESRVLDLLGNQRKVQPDLVQEAQAESHATGKPFAECLLAICEKAGTPPTDEQLLSAARGDELAKIVKPLATLVKKWKETEDLARQERELKQKLSSVQRKLRPKPEEEKAPVASADEEADDDDQDDANSVLYELELTGTFKAWAAEKFYGLEKGLVHAEAVADVLAYLADLIHEGFEIATESAITVRPCEEDESSDNEVTE